MKTLFDYGFLDFFRDRSKLAFLMISGHLYVLASSRIFLYHITLVFIPFPFWINKLTKFSLNSCFSLSGFRILPVEIMLCRPIPNYFDFKTGSNQPKCQHLPRANLWIFLPSVRAKHTNNRAIFIIFFRE